MKNNKLHIIILAFILMLFLTNCTNKKEEVKFKKKDRAPDSISDVSSNIQDILKSTEKIEKILDGTYIEKQEEEGDKKEKEQKNQGKQEESEGKEDTEEDSEGKKNSEDKKQEEEPKEEDKSKPEERQKEKEYKKIEDLKKTWEEIEKKLEDVHKKWNTFEVEGMKKGMTKENGDSFRNSLSDLTKSIENENIANIYNYSAECFLNLSPIFNLYKDEIQGEIDKIKYIIYKSYLMGMGKEINKGETILGKAEENINLIRLKIEEDDDKKLKSLEKLKLSILDMKESLKKQSIKLNRIKKDIIIDNLKELNN